MKELVERIKNDGRVLGEGVLKVDSFITLLPYTQRKN